MTLRNFLKLYEEGFAVLLPPYLSIYCRMTRRRMNTRNLILVKSKRKNWKSMKSIKLSKTSRYTTLVSMVAEYIR